MERLSSSCECEIKLEKVYFSKSTLDIWDRFYADDDVSIPIMRLLHVKHGLICLEI